MVIVLPWPPTVNHYWQRHGKRLFVSKRGMDFRKEVNLLSYPYLGTFSKKERLFVSIEAYPPDNRRRDLDNILKSLLDALQHAGLYEDDNQIDKIYISREKPNLGQVKISLSAIQNGQLSSIN
jgi:crossover junction endodeoxyribonuclease RusA